MRGACCAWGLWSSLFRWGLTACRQKRLGLQLGGGNNSCWVAGAKGEREESDPRSFDAVVGYRRNAENTLCLLVNFLRETLFGLFVLAPHALSRAPHPLPLTRRTPQPSSGHGPPGHRRPLPAEPPVPRLRARRVCGRRSLWPLPRRQQRRQKRQYRRQPYESHAHNLEGSL